MTVTDRRSQSRVAWLTAGVLGMFVAVLVAGLVVLLIVRDHRANPALNAREQSAVDSASREIVNMLSLRLAHFDADFDRASDGLTGDLLKALTAKRTSLEAGLKRSKQDTTATVTQAGFKQASGNNAVVLMTMNNYRVDAKGKKTLFGSGRFEITVTMVGGRWLASDLTSIGLM